MPSDRPAGLCVGDLMSTSVVTLEPHLSAREAARVLDEHGVGGAPVVDAQGHILGVISKTDLVQQEARERSVGELGEFFTDVEDYRELERIPADRMSAPVEKLMSREIASVERDTLVDEAASIMRGRGVHRLLVTEGETLVGVITSQDLLRAVAERPGSDG